MTLKCITVYALLHSHIHACTVHRTCWEVTAVAASRAAKLGGTHIHRLFGFTPNSSKRWVSAASLAANALRRLGRMPLRKRFLQELRVLVIDEMSQVQSSTCNVAYKTLPHRVHTLIVPLPS